MESVDVQNGECDLNLLRRMHFGATCWADKKLRP